MSLAIISNDKVVFGLAVGIPVLIAALVAVWSRPRKLRALWALISLVAIAGAVVGAIAAFRAGSPTTESVSSPVATSAQPPPATGGAPPGPPAASCSPGGTQLQITAQGTAFSTNCLAAPAGQAFTIAFDNKDAGIPHNIHIFSEDPTKNPNAQSLFSGDLVTGQDTATYQVSPIPAGTYFFHCDVHPTLMFGTFVSG